MKSLSVAIVAAFLAGVPANIAFAAESDLEVKRNANDPDTIRCRKIEVTGSLIRKEKVCKTNAEWAKIAEQGNRNARDTVNSGNACAGGPTCNGSN